ncbi:Anaphase promoting complex subunit 7 [Borealophlyctis nickersoniae]|nr:Anaphase promoting complex subunit 7 [Borealophlyctis nickersoniae]
MSDLDHFQTVLDKCADLRCEGLFTSAQILLRMLLSALPGSHPSPVLEDIHAEACRLYGDCLAKEGEDARAQPWFDRYLHRERQTGRTQNDNDRPPPRDNYEYALSSTKSGNAAAAVKTLCKSRTSQRSLRENLLLARIYETDPAERDVEGAVECYRLICAKERLAIEAYMDLIRLGQPASLTEPLTSTAEVWVQLFVQAADHQRHHRYDDTIAVLTKLAEEHNMMNDVDIALHLADCYYQKEDVIEAEQRFRRVMHLDPYVITYMDKYASVLLKRRKLVDLGILVESLLEIAPNRPEPYIALARYLMATPPIDTEKANLDVEEMVDRALSIDPTHIEALVLKAELLLMQGKWEDACRIFEDLLRHDGENIRWHEEKVNSIMSQDPNRLEEALGYLQGHHQTFCRNPRFLTLVARLKRDESPNEVPVELLETALEIDPSYTPAITLLAEMHEAAGHSEQAIDVLEKGTEMVHGSRSREVYLALGKLLITLGRLEEAEEAINAACSDPESVPAALEAVQSLYALQFGTDEEGSDDEDFGEPIVQGEDPAE